LAKFGNFVKSSISKGNSRDRGEEKEDGGGGTWSVL
jgi:hypothetical protein